MMDRNTASRIGWLQCSAVKAFGKTGNQEEDELLHVKIKDGDQEQR